MDNVRKNKVMRHRPNTIIHTDGGCRNKGASAAGWTIHCNVWSQRTTGEIEKAKEEKKEYIEKFGTDEHTTRSIQTNIPSPYVISVGNHKEDRDMASFEIEMIALKLALEKFLLLIEEADEYQKTCKRPRQRNATIKRTLERGTPK